MTTTEVLPRKFDFSLKIVVVGDSGVGKTCFLIRFARGLYDEESQPTLGVEFMTKIVQTESHRIQLQLWDTAGQEVFRSVTRGYYRGAAGAIVMFDLTSRDTFDSVGQWLQDIKDVARQNVVTILLGNKADLEERRAVPSAEAEAFATAHAMQYFETSAKTGLNVAEAINETIPRIEKLVLDEVYAAPGTSQPCDLEKESGSSCAC
jgi:small GTP-binding protein